MNQPSHIVMEYIEPMISPATGETLRNEAWRAISIMDNAPDGLALSTKAAEVSGGTALTLPYDEARALGNRWITQHEMNLLISLSDETVAEIPKMGWLG